VVVLAAVKTFTCHIGYAVQTVDKVAADFQGRGVVSLCCLVDLNPGEEIPTVSTFFPNVRVGAADRRDVANFLGISMSGFRLPQYAIIDRQGGVHHPICPRGDTLEEWVQCFATPILALDSSSAETDRLQSTIGAEVVP